MNPHDLLITRSGVVNGKLITEMGDFIPIYHTVGSAADELLAICRYRAVGSTAYTCTFVYIKGSVCRPLRIITNRKNSVYIIHRPRYRHIAYIIIMYIICDCKNKIRYDSVVVTERRSCNK